MNVVELSQT